MNERNKRVYLKAHATNLKKYECTEHSWTCSEADTHHWQTTHTHTHGVRVNRLRVVLGRVSVCVWIAFNVCEQLVPNSPLDVVGVCAQPLTHTLTRTNRSRWRLSIQCASVTSKQPLTNFILLFHQLKSIRWPGRLVRRHFTSHATHNSLIVCFSSFFAFSSFVQFFPFAFFSHSSNRK